uniref:Nuclear receptor domain-containing protein n=1 Tax=Panagrellus redivivus TaxID=6233 RepID=A0A7E4V1C7_PANRE
MESATSVASTIYDDDLERLGQHTIEYCAVCNDVADGYHYGTLSCRGCNAFFRRAVTFNLQFVCRRGGNCVIDKNARCACRACRLKKCKLVGMDHNAVQPKKVPPKESTQRYLSESSYSSDINKSPTIAEAASVGSPESAFTPVSQLFSATDPLCTMLPSSSASVAPPPPQPTCLIVQQVEAYHEQRKRRRVLLCRTLEEMLSPLTEGQLKGPASLADLTNVYNVQMGQLFEWAEKLEEFRQITVPQDKVRLLKAFAMKYFLLDNVCHTVELNVSDRLVLANNTFLLPSEYITLNGNESPAEQRALSLLYGENCARIVDELIKAMLKLEINFGEILALRLIIFWNPGSIGLAPSTLEVVQRASGKAIKELHNWFDAAKLDHVQERLGNLLLLLSPMSQHTQFLCDVVSQVPGFGKMPEWDIFLSDLLR